MKLTVKNIYGSPYGVNTIAGGRQIGPGQSIEADFSDAEAKNLVGNPKVFEVTGYVEPKGKPATDVALDQGANLADLADLQNFKASLGPIAERLKIHDSDLFVPSVMDELNKGDQARNSLADIAALFGTDEVDELNVKAAVERLIQDQRPADDSKPADLAAAVALLDDKNDEHWTQTGQPKISALESLLGKQTSAADYAALTDAQKRTRKIS